MVGGKFKLPANMDAVQDDIGLGAADFRGQEGVDGLGIMDRGAHAGIFEHDRSLIINGFAGFRNRQGEQVGIDRCRHAEQHHHRVDGIDADVHGGAAGEDRIERGGQDAVAQELEFLGVLAEGGGPAPDLTE